MPLRAVRLRMGVDRSVYIGLLMVILVIASLTACTTAPPVKTLADGGTGTVAFQSVTVTAREFLRGVGAGGPAVIAGDLQLPKGATGRVPAVVLVHRGPWRS